MRLDVVRQPLMLAFATLLAFAVAAMTGVGDAELPPEQMAGAPSLLGGYILQAQTAWPVAAKVLCVMLIFLAGSSLGRMTVRYSLYSVHTYLAIPFYGLLACGLLVGENYLAQYLVSALLVLSLNRFYACYRCGTYGFGDIFRAGLYLGAIPLIFTPGIVLAMVVPLAVGIFKRSVRELLVGIMGYALPLLVVCYLNWAWGGPFDVPFGALSEAFRMHTAFSVFELTPQVLALLGVATFFFLCAGMSYLLDLYASGSKSRSILLFNLLFCVIAGAMFFLPCASADIVSVVAVPMAVVFPILFIRLEHWLSSLLYISLICLLLLF